MAVVSIEWLLLGKPGVYAITTKSEEIAKLETDVTEMKTIEGKKELPEDEMNVHPRDHV